MICLSGTASAGTITASADAPTDVFASGGINAPGWTKIFATGSPSRTDDNYGRGNYMQPDSDSYEGYTMTALVIRKDAAQDFTGTGSSLILYVFEGTEAMWDAGDGQDDGDLWDGTGITTIYTETFVLNDSYAEGDYITFILETPITMGPEMAWFIQMTQGTSGDDFFQIAQLSSNVPAAIADGYQYQSKTGDNLITGSPLEYYAVGIVPQTVTRNPKPANGLIYVSPVGDLSWDVDITEASSKIYFGLPDNLSYVGTFAVPGVSLADCAESLGLTILPPNTEYQWRVDLVDAGDNTISIGNTWSFTTEDYDWTWPVVVEDFDAYSDTSELLGQWSAGTGAGITMNSSARTGVFTYNNEVAPFASEITCTFAESQDWTDYGATQLSLKILGDAGNSSEPVYLKVSDPTATAKIDLPGVDTAYDQQWQVVNLRLAELSGTGVDLTQITELVLGCGNGNPGGTGTVSVNDIACYRYRCLPEFRPLGDITGDCRVDILDIEEMSDDWLMEDYSITASAPTAGLVAYYQFEDSGTTAADSSGNGYDATVDPQDATDYWNTNGQQAQCLQISGDLSLSLPAAVFSTVTDKVTVAFWLTGQTGQFPDQVNTVNVGSGPVLVLFDAQNPVYISHTANVWGQAHWQMNSSGEYEDIWNHYAIVKDASAGTIRIYHNGVLVSQTTDSTMMDGLAAEQTTVSLQSAVDSPVKLDNLQIYNTALDPEAIAFLAAGPGASVTQPIYPVLTDADLVMDGVINLSDFARLAADWITMP